MLNVKKRGGHSGRRANDRCINGTIEIPRAVPALFPLHLCATKKKQERTSPSVKNPAADKKKHTTTTSCAGNESNGPGYSLSLVRSAIVFRGAAKSRFKINSIKIAVLSPSRLRRTGENDIYVYIYTGAGSRRPSSPRASSLKLSVVREREGERELGSIDYH